MKNTDYAKPLQVDEKTFTYFDFPQYAADAGIAIKALPFSIRILVENLLRKFDNRVVKQTDLDNIVGWKKTYDAPVEIPYHPARVLMQDFTGVPAVVDLAAMRDAVKTLGKDPARVNPLVPTELIVDHSVQVDFFGTDEALEKNVNLEYRRNSERYELLKWAQKSFANFKVVPPNSGICHQVNLENLGRVVISQDGGDAPVAYLDTVVGTDSHTPMINGIGVMGWGVGGIEAEAVMLGQPYYMSIPEVIGVKLTGRLKEGVTATDLVLTITEMLRQVNVVEKFVEYFGPGMKSLSVTDRATIANMTPEYGATLGFFPVDEKTLAYLKLTGRGERAKLVEAYTKATGMFYTGDADPEFTQVVELDLSTVEPSLAGPARPQDRIALPGLKRAFADILGCAYDRNAEIKQISEFHDESGNQNSRARQCRPLAPRQFDLQLGGQPVKLGDGNIVIAAITSCTNTSNPHVLMGAGLIAKNAVSKGLRVPPFVKTSLAPGSKVVMDYLQAAGLMPYFKALGFHLAAFGCTTCIGNSGPLNPDIEALIKENDLNVAAVLSGNRNFEARIHQNIKSNFLASPMLVMAFALAGRVDIDLTVEPVGIDPNGEPVYLEDLWPAHEQIDELVKAHVNKEFYEQEYARIFDGDQFWEALDTAESTTFAWNAASTYIKNPPYFDGFSITPQIPGDISNARAFLLLGDSVTTDHISPAGAIPEDYPAGQYLIENGVNQGDFNSYGSRRGNHEVMMRGTFGNIRIKNRLVDPKQGSFTVKFPENKQMYNFDAAMAYKREGTPLIVLGGKEYGTGSSRDWAAKGTNLLGIKAVIAESYERIHRNNLVGMGVLPLVFADGESAQHLGLDGSETFTITGIEKMTPRKTLSVKAVKADGSEIDFNVTSRLDTEVDVEYFENGGILPCVIRKMMADS
ncbi:aconitate hydratase A [Desulfosarcina ovata subsp. sediminis]|uniref:Aconitate hydratase n=1 Tax=Desulfosarcina ovata subsp. sediminis TaxID=885957 RepID=A0A5K7ZJH9_9BACT|nr:aconitate hydratase AcnA [Desulfosarcina ovata]BBO80375.1 aconitate hydratase A [Desulfosarcina ovata subsp. sediminis]